LARRCATATVSNHLLAMSAPFSRPNYNYSAPLTTVRP
jgi:hypothetical protein